MRMKRATKSAIVIVGVIIALVGVTGTTAPLLANESAPILAICCNTIGTILIWTGILAKEK